jgi:hypothetical protein
MPPLKLSASTTTAFAFAGVGAGLVIAIFSLGLIDVVFYTTKPSAFLQDWQVALFIALFALSFAIIPCAATGSGFKQHAWLLAAWVGTTLLAALIVSVTTAAIHRRTSNIPDGLIPVALLAIPVGAGLAVILLARIWRRREGTCT